MKLVVADDDRVSRRMLTSVLTSWGHTVETADDGEQAWTLLAEAQAPVLALLDWLMPGLTGPQLCQRLRERPAAQPLYTILVTSRNERRHVLEGLRLGADDYLCKPYDAQELHIRVKVGLRMLGYQADIAKQERLRGVLEMAGTVCHELNQPLQVASFHAEALLDDLRADDPHRPSVQKIRDSIDRLAALTRKVSRVSSYAATDYLAGRIVDLDRAGKEVA